jgi:hypothetical protein
MNSITPALIDYWRKLPGRSAALRRSALEDLRRRVEAREQEPAALIAYALGDVDEDVVFGATTGYLGAAHSTTAVGTSASTDTIEWIRRGLALNRGAVFAALLSRGDDDINARLLPLRLALSTEEIATVCRRAARKPCDRSRAFLREWHELLAGEVTPLA